MQATTWMNVRNIMLNKRSILKSAYSLRFNTYDILVQANLMPVVTGSKSEVPGSGGWGPDVLVGCLVLWEAHQVPLSLVVVLNSALFVSRWIYLHDQNLCIPASSSFVYGAVPIGASIYVIGDLDTGKNLRVIFTVTVS